MVNKIVTVLLIFCVFCISWTKTPIFKGAEGVYTVAIEDKGSASKMVSFSTAEKDRFYLINKSYGQSLFTLDREYIDNFLAEYDCTFLFSENYLNGVTNYYYTPKIWGYRSINGKKVNVQTAIGDYGYAIGTPIIYGGF